MLRYKVCLSNDLTIGSIAGLNAHGFAAPPAPPIPAVPTLDYPTPSFWPPGACLGQNKLTRRITHRRAAIVQDGHDVGAMIPHLSIPAFNVLIPIHMLFAKRKTVFFEPRVRFEKRFAAPCSAFAMLPTPMMSCNDPISMPIASSVTDHWNTVEFGMSFSSYAVSYAAMAATVVADSVFKGAWGKGASASAASSVPTLWWSQVQSKLAGGRKPREILTKLGLEAGLGIGKVELTGGSRTASISTPGSPFLRLSRSVDEHGKGSNKLTLHGVSTDGGSAWADAWQRMGQGGAWGADLG